VASGSDTASWWRSRSCGRMAGEDRISHASTSTSACGLAVQAVASPWACSPCGRFGLRGHCLLVANEPRPRKRPGVLFGADRLPGAGECATMHWRSPSRLRADLQMQLAEPGAGLDCIACVARPDAMAVVSSSTNQSRTRWIKSQESTDFRDFSVRYSHLSSPPWPLSGSEFQTSGHGSGHGSVERRGQPPARERHFVRFHERRIGRAAAGG